MAVGELTFSPLCGVQGHKCDLVYYDPYRNSKLEEYVKEYSALLESHGEAPVSARRSDDVDGVLAEADVRRTLVHHSRSRRVCRGALRRPRTTTPFGNCVLPDCPAASSQLSSGLERSGCGSSTVAVRGLCAGMQQAAAADMQAAPGSVPWSEGASGQLIRSHFP